MENADPEFATLTFERSVPAPLKQVFDAIADADARMEWGAPSDTAVIKYDKADFKVGGVETYVCGPKSDPNVHGTTWYADIVANERIVAAERIEMHGQPLASSLVTTLFSQVGENATNISVTVQVVSFVGQGMIDGHRAGHNGSLDSLVAHFSREKAAS